MRKKEITLWYDEYGNQRGSSLPKDWQWALPYFGMLRVVMIVHKL